MAGRSGELLREMGEVGGSILTEIQLGPRGPPNGTQRLQRGSEFVRAGGGWKYASYFTDDV